MPVKACFLGRAINSRLSSKMASTFPAAIANEPPPLDASSEDEDSEEFRSHGLKLDVPSGEPTPVSTPYKRPVNKSHVKANPTTEDHKTEELTLSAPHEHDVVNVHSPENVAPVGTIADPARGECEVNGHPHDVDINNFEIGSQDEEETKEDMWLEAEEVEERDFDAEKTTINCDSSIEIGCNNSRNPPSPENRKETEKPETATEQAICDDQLLNDTSEGTEESRDEVLIIEDGESFGNEDLEKDSIPTSPRTAEESPDEFLEFQAFDKESGVSVENSCSNEHELEASKAVIQPTKSSPTKELDQDDDDFDDDFGAFQSIPHPPEKIDEEEEDEFGDFAQNSIQLPRTNSFPPTTSQLAAQSSEEAGEGFADFQDCSFQSCEVSGLAKTPGADVTFLRSKIDSIIKSLFVIDTKICDDEVNKPKNIDSEISVVSDSTWARVQDFEGSNSLMFKWLGSLTGRRLLRSLNINTSNIVYHEKWGTIEVPKFAASLVQSPLQPQSCNKFESQTKLDEHPAITNNNNTIISDDHDKPSSISTEAQEILRQLPDLSYMRANTLVFPQSSPSGL